MAKKKKTNNIMPAEQETLLPKISTENMRSTFQNYGLENKLLQKLSLRSDTIMIFW